MSHAFMTGLRHALIAGAMGMGTAGAAAAQAPGDSPWAVDVAIGVDTSVNGNVNSGAIGRLDGVATAILPNPYGDVYGTGLQFRVGAGYALDEVSELRAVFTYQSADANLVRLGDLGPSSLYGQYDDYQAFGVDVGYRRYLPLQGRVRVYGEGTLGVAVIGELDLRLSAPQSDVIFDESDFYDRTAAFTAGVNVGVLIPLTDTVDLNAQAGLRRVSGLADVDQFAGTGLESINDDSARLTFPIVVGVRFRF